MRMHKGIYQVLQNRTMPHALMLQANAIRSPHPMKGLTMNRIRTTHVGSLPRSQAVVDLIFAREKGEPVDEATFDTVMAQAVDDCVARLVCAAGCRRRNR